MSTVKTWINNYIQRDGTATIYIIVRTAGKKIKLPTGISCKPADWDPETATVKGQSKKARDANLVIESCRARVNEIMVRYRLQHKKLSPSLVKSEYSNPAVFLDFYEFCKLEIKMKEGVAEASTIRAHQSAVNKLKEFREPLMFSEITPDLINEFYRFLKKTKKNNNNTAAKSIKILHSYLNIAVRKKIIPESPSQGYRMKRNSIERVYLFPEEFQKLANHYKKRSFPPNLHKALRYFLFSCCTGLRISDVKAITTENIAGDVLVYTPVKTKGLAKMVRVPLKSFTMDLLKPLPPDPRIPLFDTYADGVTNRYLKNIADLAGIDKKITTHTGRHTFATLYLKETKNLTGLKELLGHTNVAQTMVYAHVIYEDVAREMEFFDRLTGY